MTAHLGGPTRLLELGSGGGQFAVAAALLGHDVTAIERVPLLASHGRSLAQKYGARLDIKQDDFFTVKLPDAQYGAVCCWDTFGIGEDADQRRCRKASWFARNQDTLPVNHFSRNPRVSDAVEPYFPRCQSWKWQSILIFSACMHLCQCPLDAMFIENNWQTILNSYTSRCAATVPPA